MILKSDCIFCNKERRKKITEKGIWTTEATTVLECQGWKTVLETAENKNDANLLRESNVLICLHVEHVFTAVVAPVSEKRTR